MGEPAAGSPPAVDQFAALGWRRHLGEPEYLLVTSRRTRRWIFPKGSADAGETAAEAALREAAEEAGVEGRPGRQALGRYRTLKIGSDSERWLTVELWPVEIQRLRPSYPEQTQRQRRLVGFETARRLLSQNDMVVLLERFHAALTRS